MEDLTIKKRCPIEELTFEHLIGCYNLAVKVGTYYEFNNLVHTNQRHYHDCYELVIVLDGSGTFIHEDQSLTLKSGDIYIANPYSEHEISLRPTGVMSIFYMFFTISDTSSIKSLNFEESIIGNFIDNHQVYLLNNKSLLAYIQFIENYTKGANSKNDPWLIQIITQFILHSLEGLCTNPTVHQPKSTPTAIPTFEWILDYIDQNIERKISAKTITNEIGLSKSTLYRMFSVNLNRSVHDYIKERKIEMAKHYLSKGFTVTEVSGLVNLEDTSYFSRLFKSYTGTTPSQYKSSHISSPMGIGRRLP